MVDDVNLDTPDGIAANVTYSTLTHCIRQLDVLKPFQYVWKKMLLDLIENKSDDYQKAIVALDTLESVNLRANTLVKEMEELRSHLEPITRFSAVKNTLKRIAVVSLKSGIAFPVTKLE